ncbi:MAG TPA: FAD-dependent oxidoreductase, partial [Pyrinomonadaceae bacterium]|nr:FAD-dependent oxidoreductase [Pyrinomonadaceae bacterium]
MAKPRVLILGGGFGGLFTTLDLAGSADVTLVSDDDHFLFTPMLYEYLSGEVEEWHIAPKFSELLDEDDVHLIYDRVTSLDLDSRRVTLQKRRDPLEFDVLVLAVGGISNYVGVEGAEQFSFPFRKIPHADAL